MNGPDTHRAVAPPSEPILGYSPPGAHPRLLELEGEVNRMAGEWKHLATKDDVTNAMDGLELMRQSRPSLPPLRPL